MLTMQQVLDQLAAEGQIDPADQPLAAATLAADEQDAATPWYIRALVGVSAWFAAILLLIFLFGTGLISGEVGSLVVGAIFCAVASGLYRGFPSSTFLAQLALALSLAGQAAFIVGVAQLVDSVSATAVITVLLELVLIVVYPDRLHRFLATLVIVAALTVLLRQVGEPATGLGLADDWVSGMLFVGLIVGLAAGVLFAWEGEAALAVRGLEGYSRPIGYGLAVGLLGLLCLPQLDGDWPPRIELWLAAVGLLLVLLGLEYLLLDVYGVPLRSGAAVALLLGTALLLLPAFATPGLLASVLVLLLGFRRGNQLLLGLAMVFLALFLISFYYNLQITLLAKSLSLMGSGVLLFALRYSLLRTQSLQAEGKST